MAESTGASTPTAVPESGTRNLGAFWVERCHRRIRAYLDGVAVVDSKQALLVFEGGPLGTYWFPASDVRRELLVEEETSTARSKFWSVRRGDGVVSKAAHALVQPGAERAALQDHLAFYWNKMDAWFEEDDEAFVEPRNPYHRVDVLHSSRHIRVELEGQLLAETRRPRLLFETSLPVRYYIPKQDWNTKLLVPSATTSRCPYKGVAAYWSVQLGERRIEDVVWSYPLAIAECPKIENLLCPYNEKVDLWDDGVLQPRPQPRQR